MMQRFDSTSSICSNKSDKFVEIMISHMAGFEVQVLCHKVDDCTESEQSQQTIFSTQLPIHNIFPSGCSITSVQSDTSSAAPLVITLPRPVPAQASYAPAVASRGKPAADGRANRKNWHGVCSVKEHRSFGCSIKSCRECVSSSMTYNAHWCPICWQEGVAEHGAPNLVRFKACRPHAEDYAKKQCPCGRRWTDCLDCRDAGVDPRAGTAFCRTCRKRFGAGKVDFCSCKNRP